MVISLAPNFGWNNHQGLNFEVHLANFPISGWTQSRRSKSSGSWATSPVQRLVYLWFQLEDTSTNLTFLINHRCKHRMSFIRKTTLWTPQPLACSRHWLNFSPNVKLCRALGKSCRAELNASPKVKTSRLSGKGPFTSIPSNSVIPSIAHSSSGKPLIKRHAAYRFTGRRT